MLLVSWRRRVPHPRSGAGVHRRPGRAGLCLPPI